MFRGLQLEKLGFEDSRGSGFCKSPAQATSDPVGQDRTILPWYPAVGFRVLEGSAYGRGFGRFKEVL